MGLGHLLGRPGRYDVPAGGEHRGVQGVPEFAPDDEPLEVLAHGPRLVRDEWRAHDRLEAAVAQGLGRPVERDRGGRSREGDAVACEVDRPGPEAVRAAVAEHGERSGGRGVGDPEREGRLGRVVLIGLETVGGVVGEVLSRAWRHEAPVGPPQEDLRQVGVVGAALGAVGDAQRDPALVAVRDVHELDVRCLADGVAARSRRRAPSAELVPLVRVVVPDVDPESLCDVLGGERDRRLGGDRCVHRVEVRHRLAEVEGLAGVGKREAGGPECRQRPALGRRLRRRAECASDALGEVEGLEGRAVELQLDRRICRLSPRSLVAQAKQTVVDLRVRGPRLGAEVRHRRTCGCRTLVVADFGASAGVHDGVTPTCTAGSSPPGNVTSRS